MEINLLRPLPVGKQSTPPNREFNSMWGNIYSNLLRPVPVGKRLFRRTGNSTPCGNIYIPIYSAQCQWGKSYSDESVRLLSACLRAARDHAHVVPYSKRRKLSSC